MALARVGGSRWVRNDLRWLHTQCRVFGVPPGRECSENFGGSAILAVRPSLTGSRGEYLRVVGIHSDGWIDRDISLVCYPFQEITVFPTRENPRSPHFRDTRMRRWPPEPSRTLPTGRNSWHTTLSMRWVREAFYIQGPSAKEFALWLNIGLTIKS